MSYPPAAYDGPGETSATLRAASQPPELSFPGGTALHYLATGATTGGRFGLYRYDMPPRAGGPGAHVHRSFSESFFVLAGTVRVLDGRDWVETGPGDWIHVPEGGIHGFRNDSDEPASMLIHFAPGAPREGYFEGLPGLATMSEPERAAFFAAHDTYWV